MSVRLEPGFVQSVRDAIDLVDLVGEHTSVARKGQRYEALCPFHKEKTPSFSIDPSQGLFYCFGCGAGGDAIGFFMQMTGDDFATAIEALAHRYGVPMPETSGRPGRDPRTDERVLGLAARFFVAQLARSETALGYLRSRSIPQSLIDEFHLGFAPDQWQALAGELEKRVSIEELERAGLVARSESGRIYDRFRNRLMFPIRSPAGRLVGFGGRALGDDRAKYINTRETQSFQKSFLLYGLDRAKSAIREQRKVLLVEGYFDVIGAIISGIDWVVASMGTSLTAAQVRLLKRYADEVVIGYDGDRAGEEASRKAMRLLLAQGLVTRRARFPAGQDPDSLRLDQGPNAVLRVVEEAPDAIELEIERLPRGLENEPALQSKEAAVMRELLSVVPDPVLRMGYGKKAAERLGVPEDALRRATSSRVLERPSDSDHHVSEVTSLEERALQLLLTSPLPMAEPVPAPEVFLDPSCREIYVAFRAAASSSKPGGTVTAENLLAHMTSDAEALRRVARVTFAETGDDPRFLLEDSSGSRREELAQCLRHLDHRWKRRRDGQLKRELLDAQRSGDQERLRELLELKVELSRQLHGADREGG